MITEHLMRLGGGSVQFRPDVPMTITNRILDLLDGGVGAAVVVTDRRVDPLAFGDVGLLSMASFAGPIIKRPNRLTLEFDGMGWWLDSYIEATVARTAGTPTQWVTDLAVHNGLTIGVNAGGGSNVSREFPAHSVSRREALDAVAAAGGWEYRINPNGTIDFGSAANLFESPPLVVLTRRRPATALGEVRGIEGGLLDQSVSVGETATKAVALTKGSGAAIASGSATQAVALRTRTGAIPSIVKVVDAPSDASTNATALATNFLNLQTLRRSVQVSSKTHKISSIARPGDEVYLHDPVSGLVDTGNQVMFEGQVIFPILVRLLAYSRPIEEGFGVYIRPNAAAPEYIDVSDWVAWDTGDTSWTVGTWTPVFGRANRSNPAVEDRTSDETPGFDHETIAADTAFVSTGTTVLTTPALTFSSKRRYKVTYECRAVTGSTVLAGVSLQLQQNGVPVDGGGLWAAVGTSGFAGAMSSTHRFVGNDLPEAWTMIASHSGHSVASPTMFRPKVSFEDIGPA
jgi:hypothetical protein